jgi:signal transduction histidine kinase
MAQNQNQLAQQMVIYARELKSIYDQERAKRLELESANTRLRELDEMKSTFVELVSHELRTPVTVISGYLEVISEMLKDRLEAQEAEYLSLVNEQSQQLSLLVEDITNFAYITRSTPLLQLDDPESNQNLSALINHELERNSAALDFLGLTVTLDLPDHIPPANLEPARFRVIVQHLINNAIKFNHHEGWIKISCSINDADPEKRQLVLTVGNSGSVIPPDKIKQIFEAFRQAQSSATRNYSGMGLGLALVQHAVAKFRGEISLTSSLQTGTCFTITLPYLTWQDPTQLKQRLEQIQSMNLAYARDLRRLYDDERKRSEELANLSADLAEKKERLDLFLSKLLTAQEEERRSIARDLHDGLAQMLTFSSQMIEMIEIEAPEVSHSRAYQRAKDSLKTARTEVRRMIAGLRPDALDRFGLVPTLRDYFNIMAREENWEAHFEVEGDFGQPGHNYLKPQIEVNFFRIAQEALTNIRKHAHTNKVRLLLKHDFGSAMLLVQDWGNGFQLDEQQKSGQFDANGHSEDNVGNSIAHFGLVSMEERVRLLGGEFKVISAPGSGTTLVARVPLSE